MTADDSFSRPITGFKPVAPEDLEPSVYSVVMGELIDAWDRKQQAEWKRTIYGEKQMRQHVDAITSARRKA